MNKFSKVFNASSKLLKMTQSSSICTITKYEENPLKMFQSLLAKWGPKLVTMNVATLDSEFGVLNRTVVYRGTVKDDNEINASIVFVTERNTQKYKNLKDNPKIAVTFLFPEITGDENQKEIWQVRLFDAEATELNESEISSYWGEEGLHAKIRSHICECGKPVNHPDLIEKHNQLLKEYENDSSKLEQTKTYTVFKIIAKRWDFYMSKENSIADRIQYRREKKNNIDIWSNMHVEP